MNEELREDQDDLIPDFEESTNDIPEEVSDCCEHPLSITGGYLTCTNCGAVCNVKK